MLEIYQRIVDGQTADDSGPHRQIILQILNFGTRGPWERLHRLLILGGVLLTPLFTWNDGGISFLIS